MSDGYAAAYAEGVRDGETNVRMLIEEAQVLSWDDGFAAGFEEGAYVSEREIQKRLYETLRRAGLPILEGVTVRWDAATNELVASDGGREVRFS